jgi:ankyrin repeat and MYND domain-containing protein 1
LQHTDPYLSVKTKIKIRKISRKIQTIIEESDDCIELNSDIFKVLLQRGADPTAHLVSYPALAYVISHGDVEIAKLLIEKGVNTHHRLSLNQNPTPLCLATGIIEDKCVEIVEFLLKNNANPNEFTVKSDEYTTLILKDFEARVIYSGEKIIETGRSPLHIACSRSDSCSVKLVKLLIENSANPNLVCNGQSPLSLAISVGNKDAIKTLLSHTECNVNLPLSRGVGNALTVACSTLFEDNWPLNDKIELVETLVEHGADLIVPIVYGSKKTLGNIVDYVYSSYTSEKKQLIRRINSAKLTIDPEKEKAKNKFQAFLAGLFRKNALKYISNGGRTFKCKFQTH